ncbi:MAG: anaerobic ribonucleoside-triphosphate reductase activating protein [Coriobacteriaceae bacterium]|nr:anaerobic ribonucleoside-triphosphate reductase activating protein [Coriobacteriaceae bacterium]
MIISGMVKSSLVDYPGLVSTVLFTPGCNYNCFYCHNRQLIESGSDGISQDAIEDFLTKRSGLLDAVVITGGEPTLHSDLIPYLASIKRHGYKIKLDSNGSSPQVIRAVLESRLCDYFAIDYKAPTTRYVEFCGKDAKAGAVLDTITTLIEANANFEVRTTVVPQLGEDDLVQMAKELPIVPRYVLNRYRPPELYLPRDRERIAAPPYSQAQIETFAATLRKWQPNATS